jgi:hypothetical protein
MLAYISTIDETMRKGAVAEMKICEIAGVLLAVIMLCCLVGGQKVKLPVKEEMAESSTISTNETSGFEDPTAIPETAMLLPVQRKTVDGNLQNTETSENTLQFVEMTEATGTEPEEVPGDLQEDTIPDDSVETPGISGTEGQEEVDESADTFMVAGGFLCDSSGRIIDCSGVCVVDGVLSLPSDSACRGIAAGAFDTLGDMVFEIYIPANIVDIDLTVFEELTELMYVEVHPENPRYGSSWGMIYEK